MRVGDAARLAGVSATALCGAARRGVLRYRVADAQGRELPCTQYHIDDVREYALRRIRSLELRAARGASAHAGTTYSSDG